MDCKFAERVSLLIDGELPPRETEQVEAHIADCPDCRQLKDDFLNLRQQIKESVPEAIWTMGNARRRGRPPIQGAERKTPFWKRRISLPAPVFVSLLFLLAAFGIWALTAANSNPLKEAAVADGVGAGKNTPVEKSSLQNTPGEISLSRYDKGGRAEIYTVQQQRRPDSAESEKLRSIKQ